MEIKYPDKHIKLFSSRKYYCQTFQELDTHVRIFIQDMKEEYKNYDIDISFSDLLLSTDRNIPGIIITCSKLVPNSNYKKELEEQAKDLQAELDKIKYILDELK